MKQVVIASAVTLACAACEAQTTFQTLGRVPPSGSTYAMAVSADAGVVAGRADAQIFRWTEEEGLQLLGLPPYPYDNDAIVTAVSQSYVIGYALDYSQKLFPSGAFWWHGGPGIEYLGPPGGTDGSMATAITDDGSTIFGKWDSLPEGGIGAYQFSPESGFTYLGDFRPLGASGDGHVLVGGGLTAFRWTAADGYRSIGDLPGGETGGYATDASYDGSVIVGASRSARCIPSYHYEAFRWTLETGMIGLGALPAEQGNWFWSYAAGVSADGNVVIGDSVVSYDPQRTRGFIWRPGPGMQSLQDVLVNEYGLGAALADWTIWSATGISADGRTIVGGAVNTDGHGEAYVVHLGNPACPADFNADAALNSQDFFDFLHAFFTADPAADFNRDSHINSQDFFDYLAAFFAGCP